MASNFDLLQYIADQMARSGETTYKKVDISKRHIHL